MDYCLSYFSAFNLLMSSSRPFVSLPTLNGMVRAPLVPESSPGAAVERELVTYYGHLPEIQGLRLQQEPNSKVDLLIREVNSAFAKEYVSLHICNSKTSLSMLLPIDAGQKGFVTSPEFTYLQIASKLDFIGVILAGSALCSDYFLNQNGHGGVSQRPNGPLTNRAAISKFLSTQERKRGIVPAKRALQYIVEKARSPREASLALLLGLPYNLGGFNLGTIELNMPIELENRYGEKITRIPDLTIQLKDKRKKRATVLLDYDPAVTHTGNQKVIRDMDRENEIVAGVQCPHFSVSGEMLKSFESVQGLVRQIRDSVRITARETTISNLELRQRMLYERLFKSRQLTRVVKPGS